MHYLLDAWASLNMYLGKKEIGMARQLDATSTLVLLLSKRRNRSFPIQPFKIEKFCNTY